MKARDNLEENLPDFLLRKNSFFLSGIDELIKVSSLRILHYNTQFVL
jgi:hypothetical protein